MNREDFAAFAAKTLDDVIQLAEEKCGNELPHRIAFQWLGHGTLLIVGSVAGYAPRPFGRNWTGRDGPFVHIVGAPFLNKMAGKKDLWSADKPFGFITPDVAKPH
jgi:hypothetical protein